MDWNVLKSVTSDLDTEIPISNIIQWNKHVMSGENPHQMFSMRIFKSSMDTMGTLLGDLNRILEHLYKAGFFEFLEPFSGFDSKGTFFSYTVIYSIQNTC